MYVIVGGGTAGSVVAARLAENPAISVCLIEARLPSWLSVLAGLVIGAALGLVNGLLIQLFRLPSIIATLSIFRRLTFAVSSGTEIAGPDRLVREVCGRLSAWHPYERLDAGAARHAIWLPCPFHRI